MTRSRQQHDVMTKKLEKTDIEIEVFKTNFINITADFELTVKIAEYLDFEKKLESFIKLTEFDKFRNEMKF